MPADHLLSRLLPPALTLLVQSTVILALGLLAAEAMRQRGPAAQSLLCRATLAAIALGTLLSVIMTGRIAPLWRISAPILAPAADRARPGSRVRQSLPTHEENTARVEEKARAEDGARQAAPLHPSPVAVTQTAHPHPPPRGGGGETLAHRPSGISPRPLNPASPAAPARGNSPLPPGEGVGGGSAALALWLLGTLLQLLWLAGCRHYLTRLRRRSRLILTGDAAEILTELCAARRLSPPALLASPQARSPFLTGVRRPAIILPAAYERDFDHPTLRAVLAHEVAHLARRDCAWLLLARLTCAFLWPQLLVWLVARQLERTAEEVCDREALAAAGSPRAYADCLLRLAERGAASSRDTALSTAVVPFRSSLGRRIHAMLQKGAHPMPAPTPRLRAAVTLGAVAAAILGVFPVSFAQSPPTPTPEEVKAQQIACQSNMRQIGLALMMYVQDYDERFPLARNWEDGLYPYTKNRAIFHDPAAPAGQLHSYAFNRALSGKPLARLKAPAETIALFETTKNVPNASDTGQSLPRPGRHPGLNSGYNNFGFADGHVKVFADNTTPSFAAQFTPATRQPYRLRRAYGTNPVAQHREYAALVPEYTKAWVRLYFLEKHMNSLRTPVYDSVRQQVQQKAVAQQQRNTTRDAAIARRDAEIARLKARVQQLEHAQRSRQHSESNADPQRKTAAVTQLQALMAQRQTTRLHLDEVDQHIDTLNAIIRNTSPQLLTHLNPRTCPEAQILEVAIARRRAQIVSDMLEGRTSSHPTILHERQELDIAERELSHYLKQPYIMAQVNPKYLTLKNQQQAAVQQQQVARAEIATLDWQIAGLRSER